VVGRGREKESKGERWGQERGIAKLGGGGSTFGSGGTGPAVLGVEGAPWSRAKGKKMRNRGKRWTGKRRAS
jgi:hypothetical protein